MDNATKNKLRFLASVKQKYPALYRAATTKSGSLGGLGITVEEMLAEQDAFAEPKTQIETATPWYQTAINATIDAIKNLAPAYVGIKQAQTCLEINASRARQGLSPIDCGSSGIAPQVAVGVSPDVKTFLYVALGVGVVWVLLGMRKK